jgi:hypothetical protein
MPQGYDGAMEDDHNPQHVNDFVDIPEVSDATVRAMLADLEAADLVRGRTAWPEDPRQRAMLRLQTMSAFWRAFGRPVWVRS